MRTRLLSGLLLVLAGCAGSPSAFVQCNCPRDGSGTAEISLSAPSGKWITSVHWIGETIESYTIALPTKQADSRTYAYSEVRLFDQQLADALSTRKEVP